MTMNLMPNEVKLIELIRSLPSEAAREIQDFAAFKASRAAWNHDDPPSCAAAWEKAASDPTFIHEVQSIQAEFAATESDGLSEDY